MVSVCNEYLVHILEATVQCCAREDSSSSCCGECESGVTLQGLPQQISLGTNLHHLNIVPTALISI